jgi:mannose-1-phosphate guanylyltransferase
VFPALVLTAGYGSRLDPLTRLVAKPAVPIAGRTIIERVLDWLRRQGVHDVVLNLHYRPETITEVVGDGAHLGLRVRYAWEPVLLGSAGGPRHALPLIDSDTFLIVNGDTLCDFTLAPMAHAHEDARADITLAMLPNVTPGRYTGIEVDEEDRVREFVPRERAAGAFTFIGVQIVQASVFERLPDGVPAETMAGIYHDRVVMGTGTMLGWRAETAFFDVGTPRDYLQAALQLVGPPPDAGAPADGIDATASLVRTVVWPGARVGAGASLEECVVAGEVEVPAGLRAARKVIVPAALVRPDDEDKRVEVHGGAALFPLWTPGDP